MSRTRTPFLCSLVVIVLSVALPGKSAAQSTTYRTTLLASDHPGANHQSPNLLNPWGVAYLPGQGFFIAENASGRVDEYEATGNLLAGLAIPAPAGSNAPFSKPTGIAADPEFNFGPAGAHFQFLVAADNGTIWGFSELNGVAVNFVDNSQRGALYTGIAVLHPDCCAPYVAAANFAQGTVDTYIGLNTPVSLSLNQFTDPNLPAGYSPFNIQLIGGEVFVAYAQQDGAHLPITAQGAGLINVFDTQGNFLRRFVSPGGALSAPWGMVHANPNFGVFGTALLVGNVGDGTINAFDLSGTLLGTLLDTSASPLVYVGLHGLVARTDAIGDLNAVYEVGGAQPGHAADGTFGATTSAFETSITLNVPATATVGTPVTLAAHIVSAAGVPAGTIAFFDDTTHAIGQHGVDASGNASITLSTLGVGSHSISALYVGNFDNSMSKAVSLTITTSTTPTRYRFTALLSDLPGLPSAPNLLFKNPWGLSFVPGGPFWAADNGSSHVSVFDETGAGVLPDSIRVERADGSPAKPTGIAFNPNAAVTGGDFTLPGGLPGQILFATEDGIVAGWGTVNGEILSVAPIARDDSASGAVYKGTALVDPIVSRRYLALTDFHNRLVQVYDSTFAPLSLPGHFVDPSLPGNYAPFNIQRIGDQIFVTYALADTAGHDPVPGASNGVVDAFDLVGHFVRRFVSNGVLNAPWGIVQASANFGDFSNDILIANFGDGAINAFDPTTGAFAGTVNDEDGLPFNLPGVWGLAFRSDNGTVDPNTLFFTQGENHGADGLFGSITVAGSTASTPSAVALSFSGTLSVVGIFTMNADVTAASGTPTGAVSFFDGLTPLGTAPVINGRASLVNTIFLDQGTHSITARYSGDSVFLLSKVTAPLEIAGLPDTVVINAPATAVQGSQVMLTVTVNVSQGVPTGLVLFHDGSDFLGSVPLNAAGTATLTTSTLAVGTHSIEAIYHGDAIYQQSTSQLVTIIITAPVPTPAIGSLTPISVKPNANGFTLTVNGSGFVTGSMVMFNGTARTTTLVNATKLTAVIPAADISIAGTATVEVVNPAPGGASDNESFAIDTATSTSASLTQPVLTLTAGQSGAANAQLSGFTGQINARCLNAPAGITCVFNPATSVLTIQTSAGTPKGSFALTVVFSGQTAAAAQQMAAMLTLPALLFGGAFFRRSRRRSKVLFVVLPLALLLASVVVGCGGGSSTPPNPVTQPAQASTGITLTVQ